MITRSKIDPRSIRWQQEFGGCWVTLVAACVAPYGGHPAGTLTSLPAPGGTDDMTFTAPNGKRYWDTPEGSRWEGIDAAERAEWAEKSPAEWRDAALSNGKQAEAARATARVAIGHLERVLKGGHARVPPEQRDQWRRDAEDWLTSIGFE